MSEENVEIVERFFDQARDRPDAVWDIFDEEVEWELDPAALALPDFPPASHGPEGIRESGKWCRDGGSAAIALVRDGRVVRLKDYGNSLRSPRSAGLKE